MVYCISYDLHKPEKNYAGLIKELEKSPDYWHYLKSTWLIKTAETADQLWNRISSYLDKDDSVLIIEVRNNKQGWLSKEAWDWINRNV